MTKKSQSTHPDDLEEIRETYPTAAAEIVRLRIFAEMVAAMFEGKSLGDDACAALGRQPAKRKHPYAR